MSRAKVILLVCEFAVFPACPWIDGQPVAGIRAATPPENGSLPRLLQNGFLSRFYGRFPRDLLAGQALSLVVS